MTTTGIDPAHFVSAMGRAVTGVSLVSTDGPAGKKGVTVSAISSVSANPPLVLACINRSSPAASKIDSNGVFCINLLAWDQALVSDTFAGRPDIDKPYDFDCADWTRAVTGSPVLEKAVAAFDCRVHSTLDAGTHRIFIGEVCWVMENDRQPLAYNARTYGMHTPL